MDWRSGTAKQACALLVIVSVGLFIAFVAPVAVRIAIALIALPLTVTLLSTVVSGADQKLPRA